MEFFKETILRRHRLAAAIILMAVLGITVVTGIILFWVTRESKPTSELAQKMVMVELNYCDASNEAPCIVSVGLDADSNMLINLRIPSSFPDFYLKIVRWQGEIRYDCQMVEDFPNSFYCIGANVSPGETPQFMLISSEDDTVLAQGELTIIGQAFPTIGIAQADTTSSTPPTIETPGEGTVFPTPSKTTPKPAVTPTKPSYPNPTPARTKTPSYP